MHAATARYAELRLPRYTSYPPASIFESGFDAQRFTGWPGELDLASDLERCPMVSEAPISIDAGKLHSTDQGRSALRLVAAQLDQHRVSVGSDASRDRDLSPACPGRSDE